MQERNFHQQWNRGVGSFGYTTQCDVDWVRFVAPCNRIFSVETSEMTGRTKANTRLTLFDATATNQLAQNDDISTTNLFSSLSFNFVAGQEYFIRIENMSNLTTGYYNILIGGASPTTINGDNSLCGTSTPYTIPNLPIGATVTWTASPMGIVTINSPNATQTTLTQVDSGPFTLTATILGACANPVVLNLPVTASYGADAPYEIYGFESGQEFCGGQNVTFYVDEFYDSYSWGWGNAADYYSGQSTPYLTLSINPGTNSSFYVELTVTSCGQTFYKQVYGTVVDCYFSGYTISPNPAKDIVTIDGTKKNKKIKEVRIMDKIGNIKRVTKYAGDAKVVNFRVLGLAPDVYYIKIYDGEKWEGKQLLIQ